MNELRFPFVDPPLPGQVVPVVDGIEWIKLPLPFALDHVNCWWLSDEGGAALIDSGLNTVAIHDCWETVLANRSLPEQLLVTHFHPDHSGMAGWFAQKGVSIFASQVEMEVVRRIHALSDADASAGYADWYQQNGVDQQAVEAARKAPNNYRRGVTSPPEKVRYLSDGDAVVLAGVEFDVMVGRGHAPDMLMLYSEAKSLLIAADQILPTISPNISLMPGAADHNPLLSFLTDLKKLLRLPKETLVLPSHGLPFYGLHERIDALLEHHDHRLQQILDACREPVTAAGLFPLLFKRALDAQQLSFALGESLAHLRYLENQSLVACEQRNGVQYFLAV